MSGRREEEMKGEEIMGMPDNQYKGFLLNELEDWEEVLEIAREEGAQNTAKKVERQIEKIKKMLEF